MIFSPCFCNTSKILGVWGQLDSQFVVTLVVLEPWVFDQMVLHACCTFVSVAGNILVPNFDVTVVASFGPFALLKFLLLLCLGVSSLAFCLKYFIYIYTTFLPGFFGFPHQMVVTFIMKNRLDVYIILDNALSTMFVGVLWILKTKSTVVPDPCYTYMTYLTKGGYIHYSGYLFDHTVGRSIMDIEDQSTVVPDPCNT